ncbi:MAG TPA: ATP-binding protein [Desulfuromonadaceae bacterium]|nr:ATP-binding protein [Desulfuromonadaceae bacterium]
MNDRPNKDEAEGKSGYLPGRPLSSHQTIRVLLLAVILLCISMGFIYQMGMVAIQANQECTTQLADLQQLHEFMSTLKDIETGERGYLLTGDDAYLAPWRDGWSKIDLDMKELHNLVLAGNLPERDVNRITAQAQTVLTVMRQTVEVFREEGSEAAMTALRRDQVERVMGQIRQEVAQLVRSKEEQFREASQGAARAIIDRNIAFIGVGLLNVLVLLSAARTIAREVRRREAAVLEVQRQRERYWTLFTSMDEGFCVVEMIYDGELAVDYRFVEINPAFEKHTGIKDVVGRTIRELAPGTEARWSETYGKVATTGEPIRMEDYAKALARWFDVYAFRIGPPEARRVAILFKDITRRKNSEQQLAEARLELEHYTRDLEHLVAERTAHLQQTIGELESFSYTVSHDLRSPLRAMQGFAAVLMVRYGDKLDDEGRNFLKRIGDAAVRMDRLILEVLTYSRAGRSSMEIHQVDMEQLVDEVTNTYPTIRESGAEIKIDHPLAPVLASHASLAQGVSNLLTNAVKFVPKGAKPQVHIWTEMHDSMVRFSVEDKGIGIPENLLSKVFEPFQRAHPDADYEGTGMGLAIVRKAVQRMGGDVGVRSQEGKGTTFWIDLPAAA